MLKRECAALKCDEYKGNQRVELANIVGGQASPTVFWQNSGMVTCPERY